MTVDDYEAISRARQLIAAVKPTSIPVPIEVYAAHVGAKVRVESDLGPEESGRTIPLNGTFYICVNANDSEERQRFTICHEIGHIVLQLKSSHVGLPAWSYKRPPEEVLCDRFAAELLLPERLFEPAAEKAVMGFNGLDSLARQFSASTTVTGSRFAEVVSAPCAFVFSEGGRIKHASRSKSLRDSRAWISPQISLPAASISSRVRSGEGSGREQIATDYWLHNWDRCGIFVEEARHLQQWDQTLTLLWFEDEELPPIRSDQREGRELREDEEELGLKELDGHLRWPSKKRRS